MEYMFWYAYGIKQNLCAWRLKDFPFDKCNGIFGGSGCQYKDNPVDTSSSFCQAQCSGGMLESVDAISVKSQAACNALDYMSVDVAVCFHLELFSFYAIFILISSSLLFLAPQPPDTTI